MKSERPGKVDIHTLVSYFARVQGHRHCKCQYDKSTTTTTKATTSTTAMMTSAISPLLAIATAVTHPATATQRSVSVRAPSKGLRS